MNSGVCVQASSFGGGGEESDFFGLIQEILEFQFTGLPNKKITLFKCLWYDPSPEGTFVHPQYHLQEINERRRYIHYEPFVLAQQCIQVYYASYPGARRSRREWRVVCKTKPRARFEKKWSENGVDDDQPLQPLQMDEMEVPDGFVGATMHILPSVLNDEFFDPDGEENNEDSGEERSEHEDEVSEDDLGSDSDIEEDDEGE